MKDFRVDWVDAMLEKVEELALPPPMERRVTTEGFRRRTVEVKEEKEEGMERVKVEGSSSAKAQKRWVKREESMESTGNSLAGNQ